MRSLVLVLSLAACSGDTPKGVNADADPRGPACTKAVYDLCNTEHDCTSGDCMPFAGSNQPVCTQACSGAMPCPNDATGAAGTCDASGFCKPARANMCHL